MKPSPAYDSLAFIYLLPATVRRLREKIDRGRTNEFELGECTCTQLEERLGVETKLHWMLYPKWESKSEMEETEKQVVEFEFRSFYLLLLLNLWFPFSCSYLLYLLSKSMNVSLETWSVTFRTPKYLGGPQLGVNSSVRVELMGHNRSAKTDNEKTMVVWCERKVNKCHGLMVSEQRHFLFYGHQSGNTFRRFSAKDDKLARGEWREISNLINCYNVWRRRNGWFVDDT